MTHRSPVLTISLSALRANYALLRSRFTGGDCAAVVKANAYGLGVETVAPALWDEGCRFFFVATLDEAIQLRGLLADARIGVFHGPYAGEEGDYIAHRLLPVINEPAQLDRWLRNEEPFALHVDTGMNRLGLSYAELERYYDGAPTRHPALLLSHFACANDPLHDMNGQQLRRFWDACALIPGVGGSLCNSAGIFLGSTFHFDVARPGCALYGINPVDGVNPMRPVVTLTPPILQVRTLDRADTVGYGATFTAEPGTMLATVQMGYADGYQRILSNRGEAYLGTHPVPIVGRVSMDMIVLDITNVPGAERNTAAQIELINHAYTVDDLAHDAGTIGYEIFTRLGARVRREYVD
jgi:alanine racemase